jgi:hypothetical protein
MPMDHAARPRVAVASFLLKHEALLVLEMLQTAGFTPELTGAAFLGTGDCALGGAFKITVAAEEAGPVGQLLSRIEAEHRPEIPDSVPAEEVSAPCPACGSSDKVYEAASHRNRLAKSRWSNLRHWIVPNTWRCRECEHRW